MRDDEKHNAPALVLEPQLAGHAQQMFALLRDPAIYEHENEPPQLLDWLRARFARLESRRSPDGKEEWLNWVIRLPSGELAGYVQATVRGNGRAAIAYVLASRYWGRGIASRAVVAMIDQLRYQYDVTSFSAVLKRSNARSLRLLERLGFVAAAGTAREALGAEADELAMVRSVAG